jgi:hypothetical protein
MTEESKKCFNCEQGLENGYYTFKGNRYCVDCGDKLMGANGKEIKSQEEES